VAIKPTIGIADRIPTINKGSSFDTHFLSSKINPIARPNSIVSVPQIIADCLSHSACHNIIQHLHKKIAAIKNNQWAIAKKYPITDPSKSIHYDCVPHAVILTPLSPLMLRYLKIAQSPTALKLKPRFVANFLPERCLPN